MGEQVVLLLFGVLEREGARAEVSRAGGGGRAAWTPHHILLSATAPDHLLISVGPSSTF